jgi:hypothetical protein
MDINIFSIITSFLTTREIKMLGIGSSDIYNKCRNFMTYLYNEYGHNELYISLCTAKWIIYGCDINILLDCINKKLILVNIFFSNEFNQPVPTIFECPNLKQITFGTNFNQPIDFLAKCVKLEYINFGKKFNKKIKVLSYCIQLRHIVFGEDFNKSIKSLTYCTDIYCIELPYTYNNLLYNLADKIHNI